MPILTEQDRLLLQPIAQKPPAIRCCACGGYPSRIIGLFEPPPGYQMGGYYCLYCLKVGRLRVEAGSRVGTDSRLEMGLDI